MTEIPESTEITDKRTEMEAIMRAEREDCLAAINAACERYHCQLVAMVHVGEATVPVGQVLALPTSVQVASKPI
jgi:hypothetical protein